MSSSNRPQLAMDSNGSARVGKGFQTRKPLTCGCGEQNVARPGLTGVIKCTGCGVAMKVRTR